MRVNGDLTLFSAPMALKTIIDGWSFETDSGNAVRRGAALRKCDYRSAVINIMRLVFFAKKCINDLLGLDNLELFIIEM